MASGEKSQNRKRDRVPENTKHRAKKSKIQQWITLGNGSNINARHKHQLIALSSLITKGKVEPRTTNQMSKVLDDTGSSYGLYMEWTQKNDTYYLWASNRSKALKIQFELLAVFEDSTRDLVLKKPLLSFSEGFDDDNEWAGVRSTLCEIFSAPEDYDDIAPDAICAFTRTGEKFHIRIYKIQSLPSLDGGTLKLEEMLPLFVMKPIKIERANTVRFFLDKHRFSMSQRNGVCLAYSSGYCDTSPTTILHAVHHPDVKSLRLPIPQDVSPWEGCNTNLAEYFERYYAFKKTTVPGTGWQDIPVDPLFTPEVVYSHLCLPFKMFARSLIIRCRERFAEKACFERIDMDNVFFRGNTVHILNVKLVEYTDEKAEGNLQKVAELITRKLVGLGLLEADFPVDLKRVLYVLTHSPLSDIGKLEIATDNVAWMAEGKKISMLDDLYQEFMTHMTPLQQLEAGKLFPSLRQLNKRTSRNWLLFDCRTYGIDPVIKSSPKKLQHFFSIQRNGLLFLSNGDKAMASKLNRVLQCFRAPRNAFHHLPESAKRLGLGEFTRKQVDLVVSSEFSDLYVEIQEGVPRAFRRNKMDKERAYSTRFGCYFAADNTVEFDDEDRKPDPAAGTSDEDEEQGPVEEGEDHQVTSVDSDKDKEKGPC